MLVLLLGGGQAGQMTPRTRRDKCEGRSRKVPSIPAHWVPMLVPRARSLPAVGYSSEAWPGGQVHCLLKSQCGP